MLQVASVSLDLLDSHLDDQEVADDAVWSEPRTIRCSAASFHFVAAGPPSSTFAPPLMSMGCRNTSSAIPKRGWHPSHFERIRIAYLLAEGTAEACSIRAIMGEGISCFTACEPAFTVLVRHGVLCRVGKCLSQAHRLQATVTWCRSLHHMIRPYIGKDGLSAMEARFDYFGSEGIQCCSAPLFRLSVPALSTPASQSTVANHLRENPASKVTEAVGLARQCSPTASRPGSRPSLERHRSRVQLTRRALHQLVQRSGQGTPRIVHAFGRMQHDLTCPCARSLVVRDRWHSYLERCSNGSSTTFSSLALLSTIFAPAQPTCGV